MRTKQVILCVDDEKQALQSLRQELEHYFEDRFVIEIADSGEEALLIFEELIAESFEIPVVISDQLMPGMKGDEFLIEIHRKNPATRSILLTGQASAQAVGRAVNEADLYRYIAKPWEAHDLMLTVEEAVKSYHLQQELDSKIKILTDLNHLSKTISEEVNPVRLSEKLLRCVLEDMGADYGFLRIFVSEDLRYNLRMERGEEGLKQRRIPETDLGDHVPMNLINMFVSDHEGIIEERPSDHPLHLKNNTQAYYIAPIVKQDVILGVIYIEFREKGKSFTAPLREYLVSLRTQVAISLNVALIHMNLEGKVTERTRTIEDKNKHITDSLHYARRIQLSILPPVEHIQECFPDSFVLYLPKDIVSGDFYWFTSIGDYHFLAVADCTGHGVPGAFMSVMGTNLLTQIIREKQIYDTNIILNELHRRVLDAQNQKQDQDFVTHEGMDIALCRFDLGKKVLSYSGANRPIYYLRNGAIHELKADRNSIGGSVYENPMDSAFSVQHIPLQSGDRYYLFTDGITDQFGGEDGRKYSYTRLKERLLALAAEPMVWQKNLLHAELDNWRGKRLQIDDMLLIGVHVLL